MQHALLRLSLVLLLIAYRAMRPLANYATGSTACRRMRGRAEEKLGVLFYQPLIMHCLTTITIINSSNQHRFLPYYEQDIAKTEVPRVRVPCD